MNKLTFALALTVMTASSAQADGFRPWDNRGIAHEAGAYTVSALPVSGFAPWAERSIEDAPAATVDAMAAYFSTVFRPWAPTPGTPS